MPVIQQAAVSWVDYSSVTMPSDDLSTFFKNWPFEPGKMNVRLIEGDDGSEKLQIRLQLGVMQLEMVGRPDGEQPDGFESLLVAQSDRLRRYIEANGSPSGFVLTPDECQALREEAVMYYHRYVALFTLDMFEQVIADTTRNLAVLDLCRDHAAEEIDQTALEQFRPYIVMMRCRAEAMQAMNVGDSKMAVAVIDAGMDDIRNALEEIGMGDHVEASNEYQLLKGMRDSLVPKLPTSQKVELEERMKAALANENYELASILRDELRMLRD